MAFQNMWATIYPFSRTGVRIPGGRSKSLLTSLKRCPRPEVMASGGNKLMQKVCPHVQADQLRTTSICWVSRAIGIEHVSPTNLNFAFPACRVSYVASRSNNYSLNDSALTFKEADLISLRLNGYQEVQAIT